MKVEILIYAYLAVCTSMILFNIVCVFVFQKRDQEIHKRSIDFTDSIVKQMENGNMEEAHKRFLQKKLKKVQHLMALDEALQKLKQERPEQAQSYIASIRPVFVYLTQEYRKKNQTQAAYFPYMIQKYRIFQGAPNSKVRELLLDMVKENNLYCRENALQALYSIGEVESVISALKILDQSAHYHHAKMITDGLLSFTGDRKQLDDRIWDELAAFSNTMKAALLDYFRFESGSHCEKMLRIMVSPRENQELRFSAIRYYAKYYYEPALPYLYDFTCDESPIWEYKAIAATALANYPTARTEEILKELLSNRNWYVRYNASESLEKLGMDYDELIDVWEGRDRYASEMLRYRYDRRKLMKEVKTHE